MLKSTQWNLFYAVEYEQNCRLFWHVIPPRLNFQSGNNTHDGAELSMGTFFETRPTMQTRHADPL